MSDRRVYVDTSAYLAVLLGEAGHGRVARAMAGGQLLSSSFLVLEAGRTLVRLSREGTIPPPVLQKLLRRVEEDVELFLLRDLTLDLCRGMAFPVVSTPPSLDLVHLRTALWFNAGAPLDRFLSLDEPQLLAAREFGLPA
ncbi:MAG: hypothetical protein MUE73_14990 [Planctomycetes bacterium]|jgi:hypothetical protein|nr:hypothetical protein [Planctomycetota bacterium]